MTDRPSQSLNQAVAGIIKMMPVSWRARGLRSLAGLAMSLAIVFQIGAILRERRVLLDAYKAAKLLRALVPAATPEAAPQAASPRPAATFRRAAARARAPTSAATPSATTPSAAIPR